MAINYVLQKCNNEKSDNFGQYVARVRTLGMTTTEEVANKIQKNASVKRSDVKAVLDELADVLTEQLAQGFSVQIKGLGIFAPRIRAKYQTVTEASSQEVRELRAADQAAAGTLKPAPSKPPRGEALSPT